MIRTIPFQTWREKIAPMWNVPPSSIPIVNNPFRVIEYDLIQARDRICFFPIEYSEDGVVKGYNSIYNISDSTLRFRGIYVLPGYRGKGVGHRMCNETIRAFPETFNRIIGFYKSQGVQRFLEHGGMKEAPVEPLWSEFSQTELKILYRDRHPKPDEKTLSVNRMFLEHHWPDQGFGGKNNLSMTWNDDEWKEFAEADFNNYPDVGLNTNWR